MDKVELIPWDPNNEQQYERLYDQRVACGWRDGEVPDWKEAQLKGTKGMYWIVLSSGLPGREELMAEHLARYPKESDPLVDTAVSEYDTTRKATSKEFVPVGHTALEIVTPGDAKQLSLPESTVWIKHLYISWTLHGRGIGRSAMTVTERAAASSPLNATVVALDTIRKEVHRLESHLRKLYEERGMVRPKVLVSNEEWYIRQGYRPMPGPEYFTWVNPKTGDAENVPIIYLRKELA